MNDVPVPPGDPAVAGSDLTGSSPAVPVPVPTGYPVNVEVDHQDEYSRFMPLIKWLLVIPQFIALFFVAIAAMVVALIAFFAVLFTGKYPKGMWDFMVGFYRWGLRVSGYYYLITDKYPPFSLQPEADDAVRLEAVYPERVARWRPLVAWLLVIPYLIVTYFVILLGSICSFFAFFTILFTKKVPEGLFELIEKALIWQTRANFYAYYLSTEYPPFSWDE